MKTISFLSRISAVAVLLSLLPLLDRDATAVPLHPQLRRLGLGYGEPSRHKRPRYGGRGGEDPDIRGAMGGPEVATKDSNSSEDEGDVGEVEGMHPCRARAFLPGGLRWDTNKHPYSSPYQGQGAPPRGTWVRPPQTPHFSPSSPARPLRGGTNSTTVGGRQ